MKTLLMVAVHKPYRMPEDPAYLPLFVGAAGKETPEPGWQRDDVGENISEKNATFCELTGHYWLWKNADADAYGLCHYRRYFAGGLPFGKKHQQILTSKQLERLLARADVIVPKKRHYYIETNYSQYAHAHHACDLELTRQIIGERCPEYLPHWDREMSRRSGHRFNMFVMKRDRFNEYSAWLFDILFELEKRLDISDYSDYDRRVFGFVAERLLDVWLGGRQIKPLECRVTHLESQHWGKKILAFLARRRKGRAQEMGESV